MVDLARYRRDLRAEHPFASSMQNVETSSVCSEWYTEKEGYSDPEEHLLGAPRSRHKRDKIGPPVHFSYSLCAAKVPWMTVELSSWSSGVSEKPVAMEGKSITAKLKLDLRSPDSIKAVTVSVKGRCSVPGFYEGTFLHFSETIWDISMGDPRARGAFISDGLQYASKLHGEYEWHFKTDLFRSLDLSPGQEAYLGMRRGERLPPSMKGQHGQNIISYELIFRIKRHGIRCGSSLTIPVEYVNSTKPVRPSFRRHLAYQQGLKMPRFDSDPAGWRVLPEVEVHGYYYQRPVVFSCAIALSYPLTYHRGSHIPFQLFIKSENPLILELISNSRSMRVCLKRGLFLYDEYDGEAHVVEGEELTVGRGECVSRPDSTQRKVFGERIMQGEIELSKDLTPSFRFGRLELRYFVELLSLKTAGFTPKLKSQSIFRVEVAIVSPQPKLHDYHAKSFLPLM